MHYDSDLLHSKSNSSTIKTKISPEGELLVKKLDYYNTSIVEGKCDLSLNLYFIKPEIKVNFKVRETNNFSNNNRVIAKLLESTMNKAFNINNKKKNGVDLAERMYNLAKEKKFKDDLKIVEDKIKLKLVEIEELSSYLNLINYELSDKKTEVEFYEKYHPALTYKKKEENNKINNDKSNNASNVKKELNNKSKKDRNKVNLLVNESSKEEEDFDKIMKERQYLIYLENKRKDGLETAIKEYEYAKNIKKEFYDELIKKQTELDKLKGKEREIKNSLIVHFHLLLSEGTEFRQEGLIWIIREIFLLESDVLINFFPSYLDEKCIIYLIINAQLNMEMQFITDTINSMKLDLKTYNISYYEREKILKELSINKELGTLVLNDNNSKFSIHNLIKNLRKKNNRDYINSDSEDSYFEKEENVKSNIDDARFTSHFFDNKPKKLEIKKKLVQERSKNIAEEYQILKNQKKSVFEKLTPLRNTFNKQKEEEEVEELNSNMNSNSISKSNSNSNSKEKPIEKSNEMENSLQIIDNKEESSKFKINKNSNISNSKSNDDKENISKMKTFNKDTKDNKLKINITNNNTNNTVKTSKDFNSEKDNTFNSHKSEKSKRFNTVINKVKNDDEKIRKKSNFQANSSQQCSKFDNTNLKNINLISNPNIIDNKITRTLNKRFTLTDTNLKFIKNLEKKFSNRDLPILSDSKINDSQHQYKPNQKKVGFALDTISHLKTIDDSKINDKILKLPKLKNIKYDPLEDNHHTNNDLNLLNKRNSTISFSSPTKKETRKTITKSQYSILSDEVKVIEKYYKEKLLRESTMDKKERDIIMVEKAIRVGLLPKEYNCINYDSINTFLDEKQKLDPVSIDLINRIKKEEKKYEYIKKEINDLKDREMTRIYNEFLKNEYARRFKVDKKTVVSALIGDKCYSELNKQERQLKVIIYFKFLDSR